MPFNIQSSLDPFTAEEIQILQRHGKAFERLMQGERPANNTERQHFQVCRKQAEPQTDYERVWRKYLDRLEWESDPGNGSPPTPFDSRHRSRTTASPNHE